MNRIAFFTIYNSEMKRWWKRHMMQMIAAPILTTGLYFIVFGAVVGTRIDSINGIDYGSFILPGLIMLSVMQQSLINAAYGVYAPKFSGTLSEILSAPVSCLEITLGFAGAAATKSIIIGIVVLITSFLFISIRIEHPVWLAFVLCLAASVFSLLGFIIGIWAKNSEKLQLVPMLLLTPLIFLGGAFYDLSMLPEQWQKVTVLNPVFHFISAFRWTFSGSWSGYVLFGLIFLCAAFAIECAVIRWIFKTGYRIRN